MFNSLVTNRSAFSYSSELDPAPLFNPLVFVFDRNWLYRRRAKSFVKLWSRGPGDSYEHKMSSLRAVNVRSIIKCMRGNRFCRVSRRLRVLGLLHHAALIERAHLRCRQLCCFRQSLRKNCETAMTTPALRNVSRGKNVNFTLIDLKYFTLETCDMQPFHTKVDKIFRFLIFILI